MFYTFDLFNSVFLLGYFLWDHPIEALTLDIRRQDPNVLCTLLKVGFQESISLLFASTSSWKRPMWSSASDCDQCHQYQSSALRQGGLENKSLVLQTPGGRVCQKSLSTNTFFEDADDATVVPSNIFECLQGRCFFFFYFTRRDLSCHVSLWQKPCQPVIGRCQLTHCSSRLGAMIDD